VDLVEDIEAPGSLGITNPWHVLVNGAQLAGENDGITKGEKLVLHRTNLGTKGEQKQSLQVRAKKRAFAKGEGKENCVFKGKRRRGEKDLDGEKTISGKEGSEASPKTFHDGPHQRKKSAGGVKIEDS